MPDALRRRADGDGAADLADLTGRSFAVVAEALNRDR